MTSITEAMGKRAHDRSWIVPQQKTSERLKTVSRVKSVVHVKIRDGLDAIPEISRRQHRSTLDAINAGLPVRVVTDRTYDKAARRMRYQYVEVKPGEVKDVLPEVACLMLNPDHWGIVFEECTADGEPLVMEPKGSAAPVWKPLAAPPKPAAAVEAELESMRQKMAELEAQLAKQPKPKLARSKASKADKEA